MGSNHISHFVNHNTLVFAAMANVFMHKVLNLSSGLFVKFAEQYDTSFKVGAPEEIRHSGKYYCPI